MTLSDGARVGPYQVIALVGAGGMGEVYRARDTALNRDIALKVLPASLAGEPARLTLFRREAQVLASLNHPNIAHIHGIEQSGPVLALVMEFVEGPTLADRLAAGRMPLAEVLSIARQIAEALESAHERGVVHRDLKPANIKVRPDGTIKVLDFGIAKALELPLIGEADPLSSPAFMATLTLPGALLGTAAFMSPEQARGKVVDRRTDIWAFGAVVYEMVTGARLFGGDGLSETLAAVLTRPVDWTKLPPDTPLAVRRLLARCLDRDLKMRLRDIGEARIEITRIAASASGPVVADAPFDVPPSPGTRGRAAWLVAAAATAALITTLVLWAPWVPPPRESAVRFAFQAPAGLPLQLRSLNATLAISPDGTHIAYEANTPEPNLVIRAIGSLEATPIAGVVGARQPFFSPDGKWVAFFDGASELRKVPVSGGPAVTVCTFTLPRGGTWAADGTIYMSSMAMGGGLYAVPENGGEPTRLTTPDLTVGEQSHLYPSVMPGGGVLFTISRADVSGHQIAVFDPSTGRTKTLIRGGSAATYVAASATSGALVYAAGGALRAIRFDERRLETLGDSVPLTESVTMEPTGGSQYALSATGTLVVLPGGQTTREVQRSLVWVDRQGREVPITAAPLRSYHAVKLSPDGTRLALDLRDQAQDVWIWDLRRERLERFTVGQGMNFFPMWSSDGRTIIFGGLQGGLVQNLFSQPANGPGAPRRLTTSTSSQSPTSVSPDGTRVVFRDVNALTGEDVAMLSLTDGTVTPLFNSPFVERNAAISPDGSLVAFEWSESGRPQIYVAPFPDVTSGRWQVTDATTGNGMKPVWSRDGRELFFVGAGALHSVPVQTAPNFVAGKPQRLFPIRDFPVNGGRYYDVSPDGQRFIVIKDPPATTTDDVNQPQLVVTVHWIDDVKIKLGIR
jgi:serine/threonine-protein kinase